MPAVNRVLSLLLGLVLLGGGLLTAVEATGVALDRSPWIVPGDDWYASLTSTRLGDRSVLITAVVIGSVGLALLVAQLRPRRAGRLPIEVSWPGGSLERRSAQRRLSEAANAVRGAGAARTRVRMRRGQWRVEAAVRAPGEARDTVETGLREELARLRAPTPVDLRLRIREPRKAG